MSEQYDVELKFDSDDERKAFSKLVYSCVDALLRAMIPFDGTPVERLAMSVAVVALGREAEPLKGSREGLLLFDGMVEAVAEHLRSVKEESRAE